MLRRVLTSAALLMAVGGTAWAQNSGSVTMTGWVGPAISITYGETAGAPATALGTGTTLVNNGANGVLDLAVDLGNVADPSRGQWIGVVVPLALRSNHLTGINMRVDITSDLPAAIDGGGTLDPSLDGIFDLSDIGFGLTNKRESGANAEMDNFGERTGQYAIDPRDPAATINLHVLNNGGSGAWLTDDTAVIGGAISSAGGIDSTDNAVLIDAVFAVQPKMYQATGVFHVTATFTIAAL